MGSQNLFVKLHFSQKITGQVSPKVDTFIRKQISTQSSGLFCFVLFLLEMQKELSHVKQNIKVLENLRRLMNPTSVQNSVSFDLQSLRVHMSFFYYREGILKWEFHLLL